MKTYKNKFFDKIGYKHSCCDALIFNMKNDKRNNIWKKQRKKYGGWDERATWNLNTFMTEQIYTWLKMYYKYANKQINLDFYKFTIDGKEFTERECILRIIADIEFWLKNNDSLNQEKEKEADAKISNAYKMIGIIFPVLWW